jgi:Cdc6-like AAA superfamily ATPase
MVDDAEIPYCRSRLWKQLNEIGDFQHLSKEEEQIRSRLESAFTRQVSTSILVIGPDGSGRKEIVEKVLASFMAESELKSQTVRVARVNGLVHRNENQAVVSLADQFVMRTSSERNVNIAEEDLEDFLRVCKSILLIQLPP